MGAAEFMEREWDAFRRKILDDPNAYITIGGDMINNGIKSSVTNVYEETMRPREQKKLLAEHLEPLRDRIICGVSGNHEGRNDKETDQNPLYDVFCKLNIEELYRENSAYLTLRFGDKKGNSRYNPTYTGCVMHGAGGGMLIGSGANRNERFVAVTEGLDFQITHHTHKPMIFPVDRQVFDSRNGRVVDRTAWVIVGSAWLRGAGYARRKMLPPTAHCTTTIQFYGKEKEIVLTMR